MSKDLETYTMTLQEERDYYCKCMRELQEKIDKAIEYFKYQLDNLDFYEDTKAKMLCAMGITLLQEGDKE